jgi:hypothetical protein
MSEREDILAAIRDTGSTIGDREITGGSITRAAKKLGVSRRTLQARMRFHKIPMGKAGRRKGKIKYGRRAKTYAAVATVAVVAGAVLLSKRSTTT